MSIQRKNGGSIYTLIENACGMEDNAVVRTANETSEILQGTATILSKYGTAVIIKLVQKVELSSKAVPVDLNQNLNFSLGCVRASKEHASLL